MLSGKPAFDPVHWRGSAPPLQRAFRPSLAWRLCLVAEGRFDATLSVRPAWEWDIAAGSLIAARAGCLVTDLAGRALRFNTASALSDGLIVAPPALHGRIIAAMTPHPAGPAAAT